MLFILHQLTQMLFHPFQKFSEMTFMNRPKIRMTKVRLENCWNSKRMITEGEAATPLETTRRAFGNQEESKQRSAIG